MLEGTIAHKNFELGAYENDNKFMGAGTEDYSKIKPIEQDDDF